MKKKSIVIMATLLVLTFGVSAAMAIPQPASTQSGISNGIYFCCGWGGGYPPYPPPRY